MQLPEISFVSRALLSLLVSIPIAVVASWFIIEGLKLKESAWPKMVARIGLVAGVLFYLTL